MYWAYWCPELHGSRDWGLPVNFHLFVLYITTITLPTSTTSSVVPCQDCGVPPELVQHLLTARVLVRVWELDWCVVLVVAACGEQKVGVPMLRVQERLHTVAFKLGCDSVFAGCLSMRDVNNCGDTISPECCHVKSAWFVGVRRLLLDR